MRSFSVLLAILALIFLISCSRAVLKENDATEWLNIISDGQPPQINITGRWHDAQSSSLGWGEGYLRQEQNKITGVIGSYNVKGVVSGKIVYLVFLYGGSVYYTARLEMFQDLLTGDYFKANDKYQTVGYPTSFARTPDSTIK